MSESKSEPVARIVSYSVAGSGPISEHFELDDGSAMDVLTELPGAPAGASWMDEVESEPDVPPKWPPIHGRTI